VGQGRQQNLRHAKIRIGKAAMNGKVSRMHVSRVSCRLNANRGQQDKRCFSGDLPDSSSAAMVSKAGFPGCHIFCRCAKVGFHLSLGTFRPLRLPYIQFERVDVHDTCRRTCARGAGSGN
jgi:hypothetical protein